MSRLEPDDDEHHDAGVAKQVLRQMQSAQQSEPNSIGRAEADDQPGDDTVGAPAAAGDSLAVDIVTVDSGAADSGRSVRVGCEHDRKHRQHAR